jgi:hypothetical protein
MEEAGSGGDPCANSCRGADTTLCDTKTENITNDCMDVIYAIPAATDATCMPCHAMPCHAMPCHEVVTSQPSYHNPL